MTNNSVDTLMNLINYKMRILNKVKGLKAKVLIREFVKK